MDRSNSARSTRTFSYFQQQKQKQAASHCSFWCCIVFTVFFACAVLLSCVAFVKFDSQHHIKLPSLNEYVQLSVLTADKFGPLKLVTSSPVPIKAQPSSLPRKRYAYAITITKDGFFQDGAAVLIYSIMKYSWNASYDISFIAFVHPNVTTSRPGLRQLGFHIIDVPVPINVSAIQFDFLREKINKNGCCGSAELIKLSSYRLLQYDKVIHLDADVIFLNVSLALRNSKLIYFIYNIFSSFVYVNSQFMKCSSSHNHLSTLLIQIWQRSKVLIKCQCKAVLLFSSLLWRTIVVLLTPKCDMNFVNIVVGIHHILGGFGAV